MIKKILVKIYTILYMGKARIIKKIIYKTEHKSKSYMVDTVRSFCSGHNIRRAELRAETETEVFQPMCFEKKDNASVINQITPAIYMAVLENTLIHGDNDSIIIENKMLNDKIDLKRAVTYDFERGICKRFGLERKIAVCSIEKQPVVIGKGINLFGQCSGNWYHWMVDILSRIIYINRLPELRDTPLLIDECVVNNPVYMESLRIYDANNHPIIVLKKNHSYKIKTLYYFSPTSFGNPFEKEEYTGEEDKYLWCVKNTEVMQCYRQIGLEYAKDTISPVGRKLFIDRSNSMNGLRLKNEEEVRAISEQYGFEKFNPGLYSLKEQIAAFRDATNVIGDEGAAFVNAIFGSPKGKFTIILPQEWDNYVFSTLIHSVGNRCEYLDATITGNDRDHIIDIDYFRRYLASQADE